MKTFISLVVFTCLIVFTPQAQGLFGHTTAERQRRIATEQKLEAQQHLTLEQQQVTTRWQIAAFALGAGAVVSLVVGTAIGSKTRRDCEANQ